MTELTLKNIEILVDEAISKLPVGDFDRAHTYRVVKHGQALAAKRGLDPMVARTICLLHDIGRIKSISGGKHSHTGADFALTLLKDSSISEVMTIYHAIRNHSDKWQIGSPYEELLKDSDVLAHEEDFGELMKASERVRFRVLRKGPPIFLMTGTDVNAVLNELHQAVIKMGLIKNAEHVHECRIKIRTMRSILDFSGEKKDYDAALKTIFKCLEKPRMIDVLIAYLSEFDLSEASLMLKREKIYSEMTKSLRPAMERLSEQDLPQNCVLDILPKTMQYFDHILETSQFDELLLHQLRIEGKQLKYVIEAGLISCDEEDLKMINALHKAIGRYHDTFENRNLMSHYKIPMRKEIKKNLKDIEKASIKEIKHILFYFKLRMRSL